jgi:hypothetical protein
MIKSIEYRGNGVHVVVCGRVTSDEMISANSEIIEHPDFEKLRYQLWLMEDIEDFILSSRDIISLAQQDRCASDKNPRMRVALVSDSPLVFGYCRMYEAYYSGGPWDTMVFHRKEEAEAWLKG